MSDRPRERAALLRCLGLVAGAIEELAQTAPAQITALMDDRLLVDVEVELRSLAGVPDDSHQGLERALAHVAELRHTAGREPLAVVGASLATAAVVAEVATAPEGSPRVPSSDPVAGLGLDAEGQAVVAAAVRATAGALLDVRQAIRAGSASRSRPVHALNVEAGNHVIATEPRLLLAALEAGERSWDAWPYFAARYGERGRRFTRSDSAWLVTLATRDREVVPTQIDWLAQVLAARGMPRVLLTDHLRNLHEALVRRAPERAGAFGYLGEEADRLDRSAEAAVDATTARRWTMTLEDAAPGGMHAPRLVLAAAMDHRDGLTEVLDQVTGWFSDPERFDAPWLTAVATVAAEARDLSG